MVLQVAIVMELLFSLMDSKDDFVASYAFETLQTFTVTDHTADAVINKIISGNSGVTKHLTSAVIKSDCDKAHVLIINAFRKLVKEDQNKAYIMSFVIPDSNSKAVIDSFIKIILDPETNSNIKKNGLYRIADKAASSDYAESCVVTILNNNELKAIQKYQLASKLCKGINKPEVRSTVLKAFNSFDSDIYKYRK